MGICDMYSDQNKILKVLAKLNKEKSPQYYTLFFWSLFLIVETINSHTAFFSLRHSCSKKTFSEQL